MILRLWLFSSLSFLLTGTSSLIAQDANLKPQIWLSKNQGSAVLSTGFIGNYPLLDLENKAVRAGLSAIGDAHTGSLFIVGKFQGGDSLARFGYINLSGDVFQVGNHLLPIEIDREEPGILSIAYSIGPRVKHKHTLYLDDSLKISEVIFYPFRLSQKRTREIETYLALKYSINISENEDADKRDYNSGKADDYWSFNTDFQYRENIIGLGRIDALNFYQSATWTNDDQDMCLSAVRSFDPRGTMVAFPFQDSAMLIFAERQPHETSQLCGVNGTYSGLWKIKSQHLKQQIDTVYLSSKLRFPKKTSFFLTDGKKTHPVESVSHEGFMTLVIPLTEFNTDSSGCFLMGVPNLDSCETILEIMQNDCLGDSNRSGKVQIWCDELLVGSEVKVIQQETGLHWEFILETTISEISGFSQGQYEMAIKTKEGSIYDRVLSFSECSEFGGLLYSIRTNDLRNDSVQLGSTSGIEIQIYPNPILRGTDITVEFSGNQSGQVKLEVYDQNGKQFYIDTWKEMPNREQVKLNINISGVYNVIITAGGQTEVRRIVVN